MSNPLEFGSASPFAVDSVTGRASAHRHYNPFASDADVLLGDVLGRVQQPLSKYAIGEGRYNTLGTWVERDGSPLKGKVKRVYAQGGAAQGSSIASRASNDEYDIDAMIELDPDVDRGPAYVLDLLYRTIRGEPGSRYYDVTTRCTRCIQVQYADSMHVDLTPAVLQRGYPERQSLIFHHRAETPEVPGTRVVANPFAFTEWFKKMTPPEPLFTFAVDSGAVVAKRADIEPLPEPVGPHGMSRALGSLQLLKRFRNLRYDRRDRRAPPSVLLAKLVAGFRTSGTGFAAALLDHAVNLRDIFRRHVANGTLIAESNPRCADDVLTDRWPGSSDDQRVWLRDLDHLVGQLFRYVHEEMSLRERQEILGDLFGEHAAGDAVKLFADRMGRTKEEGTNRYQRGTGALILPTMAAPSAAQARPVPATRYFGGKRCTR